LPIRTKELRVLGSRNTRTSAYATVGAVFHSSGESLFSTLLGRNPILSPAEAGVVLGGLR
jgi:hypothetical protein